MHSLKTDVIYRRVQIYKSNRSIIEPIQDYRYMIMHIKKKIIPWIREEYEWLDCPMSMVNYSLCSDEARSSMNFIIISLILVITCKTLFWSDETWIIYIIQGLRVISLVIVTIKRESSCNNHHFRFKRCYWPCQKNWKAIVYNFRVFIYKFIYFIIIDLHGVFQYECFYRFIFVYLKKKFAAPYVYDVPLIHYIYIQWLSF